MEIRASSQLATGGKVSVGAFSKCSPFGLRQLPTVTADVQHITQDTTQGFETQVIFLVV